MVADASPRSQIFPDGQYFHLRHRGVVQQSLTPHWGHCLRLKKDPKVSLAWGSRPPALSLGLRSSLRLSTLSAFLVAPTPTPSPLLCVTPKDQDSYILRTEGRYCRSSRDGGKGSGPL